MLAFFVNIHFIGFEVIKLLSNGSLVFWCESRPRLVCPPIVFMARSHFDVIVKFDNLKMNFIKFHPYCEKYIRYLSIFELFDSGPKA